jgi:hypothetical protein
VRTDCEIVDQREPEVVYRRDHHFREVEFSEEGDRRVEAVVERLPPVWHAPDRRDDLLTQAILARDFFQRDRHYIVDDGKVVIVDENTGRAMPGRSWSYGLHQAIEAREGIENTPPSRTMARMSFQHFFQRYHRLCGASGTLQGIRYELWKTYGLLTVTVPTRVPSRLDVDVLLQRQLDTFTSRFYEPHEEEIATSGRTLHELVIMASMLEREEPVPAQRPLVAGILWKRIDAKTALGVDATSRYELVEWNDRTAFLKRLRDPDDAYNTRLKVGLPPGPIGAPTLDSLVAALRPVKSEFWYYLHDAQKVLRPSRNGAEHEALRKKYNVY